MKKLIKDDLLMALYAIPSLLMLWFWLSTVIYWAGHDDKTFMEVLKHTPEHFMGNFD